MNDAENRICFAAPAVVLLLACACGRGSGEAPRDSASPDMAAADRGRSAFLARRGMEFLNDGRDEEAVKALEESLRLNPDSASASLALARAYQRDDKFAAARKVLRLMLDSPRSAPGEKIRARQELVGALLWEGKLEEARAVCEPLLRQRPVPAITHRLAGTIAYREGRLDEARRRLDEAVRLDPGDPEARTTLGQVLLQAGDVAAAAAALEEATRRDPESLPALNNLAKALERLGRAAEAEAIRSRFQEASRRRLQRRNLAPLRAKAAAAYNDGKMPEALEGFESILRILPRDPQALASAGSALLALERLDEAERYLKRSLEVRSDDDFALMELGRLYALRNDLPSAVEMLERATRVNPYAPEPHYFLAGIYYAQRRKAEFLRERDAYLRLRPSSRDDSLMALPGEPTP